MSLSGSLRHGEKLASVFCECEGGHFVGEPPKTKFHGQNIMQFFTWLGFTTPSS